MLKKKQRHTRRYVVYLFNGIYAQMVMPNRYFFLTDSG